MMDLKPCPFCGGKALLILGKPPSGPMAWCTECKCQMDFGADISNEYAAHRWNKRIPEPPPSAETDRTVHG